MSYKLAKYLIQRGRTTGMADRLGVLFLGGAITAEQFNELTAMLPDEK